MLGIPTISDRIAQAAVKLELEPRLEECFHPDSYGFRPGKSAHEAVAKCRERCFRHDWVVDIDIAKCFDSIDHELLLRALRKHVKQSSHLLYIERWLKVGAVLPSGEEVERTQGTPQGGVISPLLANLFLHYAFDSWMTRNHPDVTFERYADDIVTHCDTYEQAIRLQKILRRRFEECGLELHPAKTQIVYCKDSRRGDGHRNKSFTFLGYEFKPRRARSRAGKLYTVFTPAVSRVSQKNFSRRIRSYRLHRCTQSTAEALANQIGRYLRGWINYFRAFRPSELARVMHLLNRRLTRWAQYRYRIGRRRAVRLLQRLARTNPKLFPHWEFGFCP